MAKNDYDDLLESFMNNSQKAYNDDKETRKKNGGKLPSAYNTFSNSENSKSGYSASKQNSNNQRKRRNTPKTSGQKTVGLLGKIV